MPPVDSQTCVGLSSTSALLVTLFPSHVNVPRFPPSRLFEEVASIPYRFTESSLVSTLPSDLSCSRQYFSFNIFSVS